jgi:Flp pilus assembly CpaE family ATPase
VRRRIIAIAGAKGSPGCSFLAVALARRLAANNIPTLLLDGDAEGGGLAAMLDVGPMMQPRKVDTNAIDQAEVRVEEHLWFAELARTLDGPANGIELAGAARARHEAAVVDLGHSARPMQQQLSAASDWLLWVVVPDRLGLERADRALESGLFSAASVGLVFNRMGRGSLERAEEVLANRHRLPIMARIEENPRIADRLSHGLPVHCERGLRRPIGELARSVHPDAG